MALRWWRWRPGRVGVDADVLGAADAIWSAINCATAGTTFSPTRLPWWPAGTSARALLAERLRHCTLEPIA